jgi:hypothetical protein
MTGVRAVRMANVLGWIGRNVDRPKIAEFCGFTGLLAGCGYLLSGQIAVAEHQFRK